MERAALPKPLRQLVSHSVATLGQVIREEAGEKTYQQIETIRRQMKTLRGKTGDAAQKILEKVHQACSNASPAVRIQIAHAFALKLEIINACENAYRTHRLHLKKRIYPKKTPDAIVFVLTAHPTESRSPEMIGLFYEIQTLLGKALTEEYAFFASEIKHLLKIAWKIPMAKNKRPTIRDEAHHIYSIIFRRPIIQSLIELRGRGVNFRLRTWIGGDKDGHPGVDEKAFLSSLTQSRNSIINHINDALIEIKKHIQYVQKNTQKTDASHQLLQAIFQLANQLHPLRKIVSQDGQQVVRFVKDLGEFVRRYKETIGASSAHIQTIRNITEIFPALVVPIEFRENAEVLHEQANHPEKEKIIRMCKTLRDISLGANPRWYVRGFVISMVQSSKDLLAAAKVINEIFPNLVIPLVPLFETRSALDHAKQILSETLQNGQFYHDVQSTWKNSMEIMVGYSDSAKELGAISSRVLIQETLFELDQFFKTKGIRAVFFHGSGGSIARGGGSIEEQISWWPERSRRFYKATVQGEMIQRTFSSSEIIKSVLLKIAQLEKIPAQKKAYKPSKMVKKFLSRCEEQYQKTVNDPDFFLVIENATAYRYLDLLKIGSRPSARKSRLSLQHIRAIPWVLCWTQTRVLFPTWWGLGTAFASLTKTEQQEVCNQFRKNPVLSSFTKLTAFTLQKVELDIWAMYLRQSNLPKSLIEQTIKTFQTEYQSALQFVRKVSGKRNLLWYRPWLGESIYLRSAMIHPLNILQMIALKTRDEALLRETTTGIACGMVTTG